LNSPTAGPDANPQPDDTRGPDANQGPLLTDENRAMRRMELANKLGGLMGRDRPVSKHRKGHAKGKPGGRFTPGKTRHDTATIKALTAGERRGKPVV
jgi:hypothetical protein